MDINKVIEKSFKSRIVEEKLLELYTEGKLHGTVHTCIGQELSGAVVTEYLRHSDIIFSNHRCHGHYISFTNDIFGLISELMGKETGVCKGIGGSQHLYNSNFYSNGIQGGGVPIAAGTAFAKKIKKEQDITAVFIGDGTLGEGVLYETLNIAAKWQLPILIILEDNDYAQSTEKRTVLAGDIFLRFEAFDVKTFETDTWNVVHLGETAKNAINYIRKESKPGFLYIKTFRLKAHSKGDDIRPVDLIKMYEKKDYINNLKKDPEKNSMYEKLKQKIDSIATKAEKALPGKIFLQESDSQNISWELCKSGEKIRVITRLQETMHTITSNNQVIHIGEDIKDPYGGAFKVTKGLSEKYPERVFNTPISEAAIVGIGTGLALEGFIPFVEIMFGDFITLAFDQILNHVTKFEQMYSLKNPLNLVIRTPMGGRRGYGPTHSQSLEKHFLGIPGLSVVAYNSMVDPELIYQPLINRANGPVLLIENKIVYTEFLNKELPLGFEKQISNETFPTILLKPRAQKVDITIICYGGISSLAFDLLGSLFDEHDIITQVIIPSKIYPFNIRNYKDFLELSNKYLILEEGQGFAGFGSEVCAQLNVYNNTFQVKRVFSLPFCVPSNANAEDMVLPDKEKIISECLELIND